MAACFLCGAKALLVALLVEQQQDRGFTYDPYTGAFLQLLQVRAVRLARLGPMRPQTLRHPHP